MSNNAPLKVVFLNSIYEKVKVKNKHAVNILGTYALLYTLKSFSGLTNFVTLSLTDNNFYRSKIKHIILVASLLI